MRDDYIERGELMNNKKAKIFLCVGLICFLLTTIGVIICNKLLADHIPLARNGDDIVTQFNMKVQLRIKAQVFKLIAS